MNSIVILLVVMAGAATSATLAARRGRPPISAGRLLAVFGAVLAMHAVIIGGLMAYSHYRHY